MLFFFIAIKLRFRQRFTGKFECLYAGLTEPACFDGVGRGVDKSLLVSFGVDQRIVLIESLDDAANTLLILVQKIAQHEKNRRQHNAIL